MGITKLFENITRCSPLVALATTGCASIDISKLPGDFTFNKYSPQVLEVVCAISHDPKSKKPDYFATLAFDVKNKIGYYRDDEGILQEPDGYTNRWEDNKAFFKTDNNGYYDEGFVDFKNLKVEGLESTETDKDPKKKPYTGVCANANFPFKPEPEAFARYLNNSFEDKPGVKTKFMNLGDCTSYLANKDLRRYACTHGYAEVVDPVERKTCKISEVQYSKRLDKEVMKFESSSSYDCV